MQRKILFTYVFLVLIPLTVLFILFVNMTARDEADRYIQQMKVANETVDDRITTIVTDLKNTSAMYIVNRKIVEYVKNDFNIGTRDYVETLRDLRANVLSVKANPYVSSITYATNSGSKYSGAGEDTRYYAAIDGIIEKMKREDCKNLITPVYETVINRQNVRTITYAYSLMDTYNFDQIGYAFINIDLKKLDQIFNVFTSDNPAGTTVLQDDTVVYREAKINDQEVDAIVQHVKSFSDDPKKLDEIQSFQVTADGKTLLCTAQYSEALDLILVSHIPVENVHAQTRVTIRYYFTTVLVMLIVLILMSFFFSVWMTRPVRILQSGMQRIENGNLSLITEQTSRQDDMGMLINGFNRMVTRLKESLLREYESKDLQRKAQIKMLQSQINPHFLYNALNTIASIAELEDVPEISHLAGNLGDMFRYNISSRSIVSLEEELTQVKRYAAIQKMCTNGNVEILYNIDPQTVHCPVLKFLLQPIVENSIEHGFSDGSGGVIQISSEYDENYLLLTVSDTGKGIDSATLETLQERCADAAALYTEKQKGDNIGVLNVNFRLKSYYGRDCGITLCSEAGKGTSVTMRIKVEKEIDNDVYHSR